MSDVAEKLGREIFKHQMTKQELLELELELAQLKKESLELSEFYGNENNWKRSNKALFTCINLSDIEPRENQNVQYVFYKNLECGGRRARAFSKKWRS